MKRYQHSFSLFRWLHIQYIHRNTGWRDKGVAYHVRNRGDVAFMPDRVLGGNYTSSRQYSSAFAGVNKIPINFDDSHSDGVGYVTQNINDPHQVGHSGSRNGGDGYWQNAGRLQHQSSPTSYYSLNEQTSPQNLGHHTTENIGTGMQYPGHHNVGNSSAYQQPINEHWNRNNDIFQQSPNDLNTGHKVAFQPGGYQHEHMGVQSRSNGYQQGNTGAHLGNPSGYYNSHSGPPKQSLNGSNNPGVHTQSLLGATLGGYSREDDDTEGTLEELDAFCKDWDLEKAVKCMGKLGKIGVCVDLPRYFILMEACGKAKALNEAKAVHEHLIRFISPIKVSTFNKILEMYGKCGSMEDAYTTFNQMPERNLTSWDTMISWFARNGLGEDAIDMFTRFKEAGLKPDGEMFLGVFDACGVLGDVTEGMLHFDSMSKVYGISPSVVHYARIVHMFGSAGYLEGALEFIEKMPVEPSVDVWESLMNISRVQGNLELGDRCAEILEHLDPSRLSEESKAGLLPIKDADILKKKVKKANPLEHTKHEYRAGDRSHPESDKIYAILRGIKESLKEAGYIPETRFVLHDIDPEGKEEAIMAHSERLACTYSLITTPARMPIRIIKNLRVCCDCHNVFKIISKLVGREVVMRDAKRFHHFRDGKCSCNDYW